MRTRSRANEHTRRFLYLYLARSSYEAWVYRQLPPLKTSTVAVEHVLSLLYCCCSDVWHLTSVVSSQYARCVRTCRDHTTTHSRPSPTQIQIILVIDDYADTGDTTISPPTSYGLFLQIARSLCEWVMFPTSRRFRSPCGVTQKPRQLGHQFLR